MGYGPKQAEIMRRVNKALKGKKRPWAKIARNAENAARICDGIIEGKTLTQIARDMGASGHSTILMWVAQDPDFAEQYRLAKAAQADHFAEEIVEIADDSRNDWMEREGYKVVDHEAVNRSRLRVDTRMKLMVAYAPKRYGTKIEHEHGMNDSFADVLAAARQRRMALVAPTIEHDANPPLIHNNGDADTSES